MEKLKKVTMNLNDKSIKNVESLSEMTGEKNKTRVVTSSLEIAKQILAYSKKGKKIIIKDEDGNEQEIKFLI